MTSTSADPFVWVALMRKRQRRAKAWTVIAIAWAGVLALMVSR